MANTASCLVLPVREVDFEIKPQQLSILPIFRGTSSEKAINHMQDFEAIVSTMSKGGLPEGEFKMRLFPFSLRDDAKGWFLKLQPRSIRLWDELTNTFLDAYYLPHKTTSMRHELLLFTQHDHDTFWEAWDRYKDICNACQHHGLTKSMMIEGFCSGLLPHERRRVDVATQGFAEATRLGF